METKKYNLLYNGETFWIMLKDDYYIIDHPTWGWSLWCCEMLLLRDPSIERLLKHYETVSTPNTLGNFPKKGG